MSDAPTPASPASAAALITLSALLSRRRRDDAVVCFEVTPDWGQGRTTFGGLLSVLAVQAMRDVCGSDWPLRALQTSFVGPVAVGTFTVEVSLLRQGKNVRQVQARITQADAAGLPQVAAVLLGVFGSGRESAVAPLTVSAPALITPPEKHVRWPFIPGVTPAFTQHMETYHADGGMPYTGSPDFFSRVLTRLKQAEGVDAELLTVLLADVGPTPALATLRAPAMASSVSWALELRPLPADVGDGLWRMDKTALATGEGYVNEKTELWAPNGQLAGMGYQVVAVYA